MAYGIYISYKAVHTSFSFYRFLAQQPTPVTVLAQAAHKLKNSVLYGGASALGDGVHDDRQAFLPASLIIIFLLLLPMMGAA